MARRPERSVRVGALPLGERAVRPEADPAGPEGHRLEALADLSQRYSDPGDPTIERVSPLGTFEQGDPIGLVATLGLAILLGLAFMAVAGAGPAGRLGGRFRVLGV